MPLHSEMVSRQGVLTRDVGIRVEQLPPLIADGDGIVLPVWAIGGEALTLGVRDQLGHVVGVEGVHDVEEVLAGGIASLGQRVGEVLLELGVVLEVRLQVDHAQLVVLRHRDEPDVLERHQLLLVRQEEPQEVLRDHGLRRDVELHC